MYKRIFEGKNTAIFDLDGTVIDSEYVWYKAFETVLRTVAPEVTTEARDIMLLAGVSDLEKWRTVISSGIISSSNNPKTLNETTNAEFIKLLQIGAIQIKEGFWELAAELKLLKDFRLALVTNSPRSVVDLIFKNLYFGNTFDLVICGDEVSMLKPNPEIYLKALKELKIKAKDALVFEDSVAGVKAATKAGIDTVVIWDGRIHEQDYPQEVLGFVADFTPFSGNLDKTIKDIIREYAQKTSERTKI